MDNSIDFDKLQKLVDDMYAGNIERIKEGLRHKGVLLRINAILSIAENNIHDEEIIDMVKELESDMNVLDGIRVGEFATGLLDVYNISKYTGNNAAIKELIENKMIVQ